MSVVLFQVKTVFHDKSSQFHLQLKKSNKCFSSEQPWDFCMQLGVLCAHPPFVTVTIEKMCTQGSKFNKIDKFYTSSRILVSEIILFFFPFWPKSIMKNRISNSRSVWNHSLIHNIASSMQMSTRLKGNTISILFWK